MTNFIQQNIPSFYIIHIYNIAMWDWHILKNIPSLRLKYEEYSTNTVNPTERYYECE